jgi:hypothetical protein
MTHFESKRNVWSLFEMGERQMVIFKRKSIRSLFLCLFFLFFLNMALLSGQTDLLNAYKSGPIQLEPDADFGINTDWNSLFYHLFCDLTVAPDGSIFVASSRQHKIFKFDPEGNLIKSFGQEGQGPGDFNMPGDLSVLDENFLIVGEYSLTQRISLFDLEGNFIKLLKISHPPYWPTALRDGKFAYVVHNYRGEGPEDRVKISSVFIRDIDSDREFKVAEFTSKLASISMGQDSLRVGITSISFGGETNGRLFIASSKDGNLVVGNSLRPEIEVFSPEGTKISTIPLKIEPIAVTKQLIGEYKKYQIEQMNLDSRLSKDQRRELAKKLQKVSWDHLFEENLPLYRELLVDSQGNLILFKRTACLEECPIVIQVYLPTGQFLCETELVEGSFDLSIDPRIKNMSFTDRGLFAMVEVKDAQEFSLRLIRVLYK